MSAIIIPRRHYTQPQGYVRTADEWAAAGVTYASLPGQMADVLSVSGSFVQSVGTVGPALRVPNTAGAVLRIANTQDVLVCNSDFTCGIEFTRRTTHLSWPTLAVRNHQSDNVTGVGRAGWGFFGGTGDVYFTWRNQSNSAWFDSAQQPTTIGVPTYAVASLRAGVFRLYVNGAMVQQVTPSFLGAAYLLQNVLAFGAPQLTPPTTDIHNFFWAPTAFDEYQIKLLSENPYQIFKADPVRIYSLPPVLTIPTLSSPGVIDITASSARPRVTLAY